MVRNYWRQGWCRMGTENTKPWFSCRALYLMNDALGWPVKEHSLFLKPLLHCTLWGTASPCPFLRGSLQMLTAFTKDLCSHRHCSHWLQWTLGDGQPFLPILAEKPLNGRKSCTVKGLSKMQFPVVTRASITLFQALPCQTRVCGEKKSCKTQESVKLYSQRGERAKICHKQTDQPGAHINGLLSCVPAAGWEGYFAYHYCSYTKHSSAAAEHCKALQQGDFLSSFFKILPSCHLQTRWVFRRTGTLYYSMCTSVLARTSSSLPINQALSTLIFYT